MSDLKMVLYSEYEGFADKRIKNLNKSSRFIVDDRSPEDLGADRDLKSYFCTIFADVVSDTKLTVCLGMNVPVSDKVIEWIRKHQADFHDGLPSSLSFTVGKGEESKLIELATAIDEIVAQGAPRYSVPSYKYMCPRTATSLRRLAIVLADAWSHL